MSVSVFHFSCPRQTGLGDIAEDLVASLQGFRPLIGSFTSEIARLEADQRLDLRDMTAFAGTEIFVNNSDSCCLVVSAIALEDRRARPWFEGRVFCSDDPHEKAILTAIAQVPAIDEEIQKGTYKDGVLRTRLSQRLAKESPMARKLENAEVSSACDALTDDALRNGFAKLSEALGLDPVPREWWSRQVSEKGSPDLREKLLESGLVSRRFLVRCSQCGEFTLVFSDPEKASQALEAADKRCRFCGESKLSVDEAFQCSAAAHEAFQGLWLEKLVADTVRPRAIETFHARMLDTNELDVVSIIGDGIVLFECKDRAFGQNDFYVMAMKGQELGADRLVVVTTGPVHDNVRELIKRHNEGSDTRGISLVQGQTIEKIREEINRLLDQRLETYRRFSTGLGMSWSLGSTTVAFRDLPWNEEQSP